MLEDTGGSQPVEVRHVSIYPARSVVARHGSARTPATAPGSSRSRGRLGPRSLPRRTGRGEGGTDAFQPKRLERRHRDERFPLRIPLPHGLWIRTIVRSPEADERQRRRERRPTRAASDARDPQIGAVEDLDLLDGNRLSSPVVSHVSRRGRAGGRKRLAPARRASGGVRGPIRRTPRALSRHGSCRGRCGRSNGPGLVGLGIGHGARLQGGREPTLLRALRPTKVAIRPIRGRNGRRPEEIAGHARVHAAAAPP